MAVERHRTNRLRAGRRTLADSLGSGDVTSLGPLLQPRGEPRAWSYRRPRPRRLPRRVRVAGVIRGLESAGHTALAPPNPLRGVAFDASVVSDVVKAIDGPVVLRRALPTEAP